MDVGGGEEVVGEEFEPFNAVAEQISICQVGDESREVIRDGRVWGNWGVW